MGSRKNLVLFILASLPMLVMFQNCANNYKIDTKMPEISATPLALCYFNGKVVPDDVPVTAFSTSTVPFGQSCQSEERVCTKGELSGSFTYATCAVDVPRSCLFNGVTIPSGTSVPAFQNSSVPFGESCVSQNRACLDGALSGTYTFGSCTVDGPVSCLFNGQTIASGTAITGYKTSSVPFGSSCEPENRVCFNGKLSGSFTFGSCQVGLPAACVFNGQTISHGDKVTTYLNSSVPFGGTCASQDRVCNNGQLSGTYAYGSCSVDGPASCLFNGQTLASGSKVTVYETSTVPFGQTCLSQDRVCTNGVLSGSYTFGSCSPAAPASCLFNGQTVVSGTSVLGYKASSVPFGQSCQSESRLCTNGTLSGSFAFGSCEVGAPASCIFNGQTIPSGNSVTAYKDASVGSGGTCTSETRTCTNGTLSGSFTNASCTVAICDPFTNPGPNCSSSSPGLKGSLFYEPQNLVASEGGWNTLSTYFSRGTNTNITLVLSQLDIATRNFSVGFPTGPNTYLMDLQGNKLVEWFAIQVDGVLKLAPGDTAGNYEFAVLSDDGSILFLRDASGQLIPRIVNDGFHSTALACIDKPVAMDSTTQIPMRLQYFQGPKTEIALRMLYRKASNKAEALCGTSSGFFVNSGAGNPYPEGTSMTKLYQNGWKVLTPDMFGSP